MAEKMASMQSAYDRNARPIAVDSINDSNSNFKATAFQVKDSNVKVMENTNNHNQSSHAIKDVIPNSVDMVLFRPGQARKAPVPTDFIGPLQRSRSSSCPAAKLKL